MGDLSVRLPESAFAIGLVAVCIDDDGEALFVTATEYPFAEFEALGRASLPTALRRLAKELDKTKPAVVTLPDMDEDDDWEDEEHDHPTEKKD